MKKWKRSLLELAIFGSQPAFPQSLHVGRPNLGNTERFLERVNRVLNNRWLTNNGPLVQEFEAKIAELGGVKHCIAMCNATVALEILIRAAGLHGEVIVPAYTFVATVHALEWQKITPIFCDVDPATHCLDPRRVEELITPRTSGIIGVHVWGRPCAVESLTEIARRRQLALLFDAAHALGCTHAGQLLGGQGLAGVFSFHATKFINSFEGGAVVTNDDSLVRKIRFMKNFGFAGLDEVAYLGINGKMSEIAAAMGLTSLESLDEFVAVNRRNHEAYRAELEALPGIRLLGFDERERSNYQYVVLEVDQDRAGLSRDQLLAVLRAENVLARRYFYPGCHRMEPYRSQPAIRAEVPQTDRLVQRVLQLPTGTAVTGEDIEQIGALIRLVLARSRDVARRLAALEVQKTHSPVPLRRAG